MSKQQTYISFIVDQLRAGNVSHKKVMAVFVSKWQLSERQFTRYWSEANLQYFKEQQAINQSKEGMHSKMELEATTAQIMNKIEAKAVLSAIARGDHKPNEKIAAIKALSDLDGWHLAEKEEPLPKFDFSHLTFEQLTELAEITNKEQDFTN